MTLRNQTKIPWLVRCRCYSFPSIGTFFIRSKEKTMSRVLIKSAWGSDDPTKAAFPFLHANAFAEAGHEVQIFLLGEAGGLMLSCLADAVVPVGWPPLAETLTKTIELGINIHV